MTEEIDYRFVVHYKTYPRFERIPLGNHLPDTPIRTFINNRRTRRVPSGKELTLEILHPLITMAAGKTGKSEEEEDFRAYPSAGARYPLELYLFAFEVQNMVPGIYHFSPNDNSLEILWKGELKSEIVQMFEEEDHPFLNESKVFVIISAIEERTTFKYGEEGKDFPLIEAGYLGTNLVFLFEEAGYNSVILGTQWCHNELEKLLDLNSEKEKVISSIAVL